MQLSIIEKTKNRREMKYVPPVIFKTLDLSLENATRLPESFA